MLEHVHIYIYISNNVYVYISNNIYIWLYIYTHIYIYKYMDRYTLKQWFKQLSCQCCFSDVCQASSHIMWKLKGPRCDPYSRILKPLTTFKKPEFSAKYGQLLGEVPSFVPFSSPGTLVSDPLNGRFFFRSQEWGSTKPRWHVTTAGQLGQQDVDWLSRWYSYPYIHSYINIYIYVYM